jgi:hypothetical protein
VFKQLLSHADLDEMGVTPTSKVQRRRLAKAGKFPCPTKSGRCDAFFADEVGDYIEKLRTARDQVKADVPRSARGRFGRGSATPESAAA